jgi:hypothetical protein
VLDEHIAEGRWRVELEPVGGATRVRLSIRTEPDEDPELGRRSVSEQMRAAQHLLEAVKADAEADR